MKVLHINSYYSNRFFYKNLYDNQINQGIDINVYVPVADNYIKPDIDFGPFTKISKNHGKYDRAIFQIKHSKILDDMKTHYKFDEFQLLHAHSLFSNGYIAYKINEEYGVPYIATVRNTDLNTFFKYMIHLRKLGISILLNSKKIVFLSKSLRDELIDNYIPETHKESILKKSVIIPNGLDPFWLKNKNLPKEKSSGKNIRIIQVGIVNKIKNPLTSCKAVEVLIDKGYKVKFDVVGKVEDKRVFQKLIEKEYVNYHSPVPKEKLISMYRENDVFILPSLEETFGLVYAEAMSQGLPVLYSKGQGFDNQFPNGKIGYAIDKTNEEDIAHNVLKVLGDYEKLSERAVDSVEKFDWVKISEEFFTIYNLILR